jgi:hypothetical protein
MRYFPSFREADIFTNPSLVMRAACSSRGLLKQPRNAKASDHPHATHDLSVPGKNHRLGWLLNASRFLWFYGSGVRYSNDFHRQPTGRHGSGDASPEILARDSNAEETSVRGPFRAATSAWEASLRFKCSPTQVVPLVSQRPSKRGRLQAGVSPPTTVSMPPPTGLRISV